MVQPDTTDLDVRTGLVPLNGKPAADTGKAGRAATDRSGRSRRSGRRSAGKGFGYLSVAALVVAGGLFWGVTHVSQLPWEGSHEIAVSLAGERYRLPPKVLSGLEAFSETYFDRSIDEARSLVSTKVGSGLDGVFAGANERIPAFADWYYSLGGEYWRLGKAALSAVNLGESGFVAQRAAAELFPDSLTDDLARLEQGVNEGLKRHDAASRAHWYAELKQRLAEYRVPAPLSGTPQREPALLDLDPLVNAVVVNEHAAFETRMTLSTVAATGAALGPTLWKIVARRAGAKAAGRAIAERTAAKGVARIGTAALGGGAVCSPGGPVALGCAVVAGAAAWIGTDWILLQIDEHMNRPELVTALETSIDELHAQVKSGIADAYDTALAARHAEVERTIKLGFVPATAGEPTPGK